MFKKRISADTERRRGKEAAKTRLDIGEGVERVYVLFSMFVTFPTSHVERLPLKASANLNTAPQQQIKVHDKNGLEKRRGESIVQKKN